jgi:ABC-type antimicrobial peptide transport system permease subunit
MKLRNSLPVACMFGLRMALGASSGRIMRGVLGSALRRAVAGASVGLLASWSTSHILQSFVFGLRPSDTRIYTGVFVLLAVTTVTAALAPALRAARLNPVDTLRDR